MRFGFVNMETKEQAAAAVAALDGQHIDGARVKVWLQQHEAAMSVKQIHCHCHSEPPPANSSSSSSSSSFSSSTTTTTATHPHPCHLRSP